MKKHILIAILFLFAVCTQAQTTNTTPTANFFTQAISWGSTINYYTAYNWTNSTIQIDTGIATTTGVGLADRLDIQYNISSFGIGAAAEFTGVGSSINLLEGTFAYSLMQRGDFKMDAELGAGFDFNGKNAKGQQDGSIVVEPGLGVYKVMTPKSYAVFKLLVPFESNGKFEKSPKIYAGVGGTL
jgi:hypothetical protein